jgi:protein TonB
VTDAALHSHTTQPDSLSPTAIALAVFLHVLLVAGLWWISSIRPVIPPENAINVTIEDEGKTTLKEARPSVPPTEVALPPIPSTPPPPSPPTPPSQQAALAPPVPPVPPTPIPPTPPPPVVEQAPPPTPPPPATKPVTEEALKPPPPPPPPAPTAELQDELPPPDYVPPPTANEFPKPAPPPPVPPPKPQPPKQAATPSPPPQQPPPEQTRAPQQPRPAPPPHPPSENRAAALQPSPLSAPGTVLYGMGATGRASYLTAIARRTSQFRFYPRAALENHERGRVVVRITVTRDGRVVDARVSQSSGSRSIDAAEVETVLKSSPFPPLPPDIPGERVAFEVPVNYDLPY